MKSYIARYILLVLGSGQQERLINQWPTVPGPLEQLISGSETLTTWHPAMHCHPSLGDQPEQPYPRHLSAYVVP